MKVYSVFFEDHDGRDKLDETFCERWAAEAHAAEYNTDRPRMVVEWQMLNAREVTSYDANKESPKRSESR